MLTPQLNDQQIRANIDALLKGGKSRDEVQTYVNQYSKGTDGNYILKGYTPPVQEKPVQEEPGLLQKTATLSEHFMQPISDIATGALKGAASTIATVPSSVGKVVEAAQAPELKRGSESIANVNVAKVIETMKSLPPGPAKDALKRHIHEVIDAAAGVGTAQQEIQNTASSFAEKPVFVKPQGTAEKIGFGAEKAAEFMFTGSKIVGPGEKALAAATKGAGVMGAGARVAGGAGLEGLNAAFASFAQGASTEQAKQSATIAFLLGIPFRVISEAKGPVIDWLQESANKKANQALGATTKINKEISEKVVPGLIKRRVVFLTRGGLEQKAAANADIAGEEIGKLWDALPPETRLPVAPIIKKLEDLKDATVIMGEGGQRVVADSAKYSAAQELQKTLLKIATDPATKKVAPDISADSMRSFRQILDGITERTGKSFARTGAESAQQEATKDGADAIRNVINETIPNARKLNAEFNFWKNVEKVVGATVKRTKSQTTSLTTTIAEIAGAAAGLAKGGVIGDAALYAGTLGLAFNIVRSPAFRMASAVTKNEMANYIMNGQWAEIAKLGVRIGASIPGSSNSGQ